jgi:hypothetical protein
LVRDVEYYVLMVLFSVGPDPEWTLAADSDRECGLAFERASEADFGDGGLLRNPV